MSSDVSISVSDLHESPTVGITSPESNTSFNGSENITINATASDADGSVTKVDFYNGDTLLGSDNTTPYSFTWNGVATGKHSLKAKAYDNDGLATVSAPVSITISPLNFTFTSFSGAAAGSQINLSWTTNNTGKSNYFRVLRGKRRMSQKEITRMSAINNTSDTVGYTYADSTPLTGDNYYKIIKTDVYGTEVSSTIILVNNSGTSTITTKAKASQPVINGVVRETDELKKTPVNSSQTIRMTVGPNPTSSLLSIFTNGLQKDKDLKISVLSVTGRVFKTIQANTSNQVVQVNVSSLNAGIYLIQAVCGDTVIYKQFIKH
jgi:hypothetical protein